MDVGRTQKYYNRSPVLRLPSPNRMTTLLPLLRLQLAVNLVPLPLNSNTLMKKYILLLPDPLRRTISIISSLRITIPTKISWMGFKSRKIQISSPLKTNLLFLVTKKTNLLLATKKTNLLLITIKPTPLLPWSVCKLIFGSSE